MRTESSEKTVQLIIAIVIAISCFVFFQFFYPYHLFIKEQIQLFLYTSDYFLSYLDKPAWLARYIGDFLTQFFYLRGGGSIVITLLILLEWKVLIGILKCFRIGVFAPLLALFPVVAEWLLHTQLSYPVASTVSFIMVLLICLVYTKISNKWLSFLFNILLILLGYSLIGGMIICLPLFVVLYEMYSGCKRCVILGFICLFLAIVYPQVVRHYYLLSDLQIYYYPMQSMRYYLAAILLFILIGISFLHSVRNSKSTWRNRIAIYIILLAFLTIGLITKADFRREKILMLTTESYFGNWNKVYEQAEQQRLSSALASYYANLALSRRGELPYKLLEFYQPATHGLFLPVNPQSSWLMIFCSSDVFFYLGDMNMAQHSAMLGMIFSPNTRSSRMVRRLAEINLVNGDGPATLKFLRMLEKTLFHSRWAAETRKLLESEDQDNVLWLQEKRKQIAAYDTLRTAGEYPKSLKLLIDSNPNNIAALDYLLCFHLLNKDIPSFITIFDTYYKDKDVIPRVYAEALLIYLASIKASQQEVQNYGVSSGVFTNFIDYTRIYEKNNGRLEPLQDKYGSSYWFYYHFAQIK